MKAKTHIPRKRRVKRGSGVGGACIGRGIVPITHSSPAEWLTPVRAFPQLMKVKRAAKYGFCSGVRIADLKVKRFAAAGGRGAILGQVVHNERVVQEMENLGVRTVDEIGAVAEPTIVFSAHGVPPSFHNAARDRG